MNDKCYFEMNETEAAIKNIMNSLEFAHYEFSTGIIFPVGGNETSEYIEKVNELSEKICHNLESTAGYLEELNRMYAEKENSSIYIRLCTGNKSS